MHRNAINEHRRRIMNAENQRIEISKFLINEMTSVSPERKKQWNKMLDLQKKMVKFQAANWNPWY